MSHIGKDTSAAFFLTGCKNLESPAYRSREAAQDMSRTYSSLHSLHQRLASLVTNKRYGSDKFWIIMIFEDNYTRQRTRWTLCLSITMKKSQNRKKKKTERPFNDIRSNHLKSELPFNDVRSTRKLDWIAAFIDTFALSFRHCGYSNEPSKSLSKSSSFSLASKPIHTRAAQSNSRIRRPLLAIDR